MKSNANQPKTTYLKDYRAPDFMIESTELYFSLEPEQTIVRSKLLINRNMTQGKHQRPLILEGDELKLLSVKVDKQTLREGEYQLNDQSLCLPHMPDHFVLEIETEIAPKNNSALSGLYISDDIFCTQCEAEGFRRITYYLDRPDVMAKFKTTIEADKSLFPVMLSNGNLIAKGDKGDRHWVTWEDPFKKPAYLFALVAGDLVEISDKFTTKSGRVVQLAIFVEPENSDKCSHAMQSLKNSMKWDEEKYGREYDLDIYMIVAVNNFNMGAMENKGLNIFNSKYVLANQNTATDSDFQGVEYVIGHEYFHNWTGNRVTLRDWFQLSLKEGLTVFREQQFSADMGSPIVKRINDVKQIRTRQYAEDSGPIAHPVRPDSYIEINNFYTMTIYYKGAEVIRMLHTLLGEAAFRKGMDLYFSRHDGEAVTIEHFIAAMSDANHENLNQFMRWYQQAGTPEVRVKKSYDSNHKSLTFEFEQYCPKTPGQDHKEPFVIPIKIALYTQSGRPYAIPEQSAIKQTEAGTVFVLDQTRGRFTLENVNEALVPSFLGHYSAPVKLDIEYSPDELALLIKHDQDGFNRWDICQDYKCQVIENLIHCCENQKDLSLPEAFLDVFKTLLEDKQTDPALLAELLAIPSFQYISEQLDTVNVSALNQSITFLREEIAKLFVDYFLEIYHRMEKADTGQLDARSISCRALKNMVLAYLGRSQDNKVLPLIEKQFQKSDNMTDRIGALSAINHWSTPLREQLFSTYYQDFQEDTLVLDKWFALQAQAELPDTLARITQLMSHPAFDYKNPNKIYALIRTFGSSNALCFHEKTGKGYHFIADRVIELNKKNPQVAARVLETLTGWKRLDNHYGLLMKQALQKIQAEDLSEDVYEIVNKSLA